MPSASCNTKLFPAQYHFSHFSLLITLVLWWCSHQSTTDRLQNIRFYLSGSEMTTCTSPTHSAVMCRLVAHLPARVSLANLHWQKPSAFKNGAISPGRRSPAVSLTLRRHDPVSQLKVDLSRIVYPTRRSVNQYLHASHSLGDSSCLCGRNITRFSMNWLTYGLINSEPDTQGSEQACSVFNGSNRFSSGVAKALSVCLHVHYTLMLTRRGSQLIETKAFEAAQDLWVCFRRIPIL